MSWWNRVRSAFTYNRQATPEQIAENFVPFPRAGIGEDFGNASLGAIPAAYASINLLV